jgi:TonB-dependent starch-binding outer membrane protein SusC
MRLVRCRTLLPALAGVLLSAALASAQDATGTITGRVTDGTTLQPLSGANVVIVGTTRGTVTRADGGFILTAVPVGTHTVQASRIGYSPGSQEVTVAVGASVNVQLQLQAQAVQLEELVATGYGVQRREAITGSVATVNAEQANVGVVTNANEMIQGRVAGVQMTTHTGEPGSGVQVRIRGGTSISASNEPLYVIDGVPIENRSAEPRGLGIGGSAPLQRSPLNLLNPNDIESITILKDASATAIYGSRAANGVVLIQTKRGRPGQVTMEYDGYVAAARVANRYDVLSGDEYRAFRISQGASPDQLGTANTNWENELYRTGLTHNHNLSFSGGTTETRYRASLNFMNQEGVVIANGFERLQGRLNASHTALSDRLRLGLNLTASRVNNNYLPFENIAGFEGGVFTNAVIFDPTRPVQVTDPQTGVARFFETGAGRQSLRNPVALARQVADEGNTTRTLGNVTAALDLIRGVTFNTTLGVDQTDGIRRTYWPKASPVGAEFNGRAWQEGIENNAITLQTFLTLQRDFARIHAFDMVGGYEFAEYSTAGLGAENRNFTTDAFGFHNLGGGATRHNSYSWREESRLVSFFGRANYSLADRYFLTGVLRYDGSSRFGEGNKWALFPAISASWRISEEGFMRGGMFSDLRLRAGYGLQGNPGVAPYSSLITIAPGGNYVFGEQLVAGFAPNRNPNPNLKWEETAQFNVALDYGLANNRFTGTLEFYNKETTDLLLSVPVVQPAVASSRLENVGSVRNRGVEFTLDALAMQRPGFSWLTGLVFAAERNEVVDLGGREFLTTGGVAGEGQSGQVSQRIMPGQPLGTFFGNRFVGFDEQGRQMFACERQAADCVNGRTLQARSEDYEIIGGANPDFTLGFRNNIDFGNLDLSFLLRGEFGRDVFNNTALVFGGRQLGGRNFLRSAMDEPDPIGAPRIYSSRYVEDGSFVRLQNVTLGYSFAMPGFAQGQRARLYVSGDNLLLFTGYSGLDPEVHTDSGLASRGLDYLNYPRARTITTGIRFNF